MVELSNEAQDLLIKFQTQNQQLQELTAQKQGLELQKLEIEEALKEIEDKNEIYKEIAGLLMKIDKAKIKKDLEEERDLIEIKNKQIADIEEKLKQEIQKDKGKLETLMKGTQAG
jgi:prefoldin beta subunit